MNIISLTDMKFYIDNKSNYYLYFQGIALQNNPKLFEIVIHIFERNFQKVKNYTMKQYFY